MLGVHFKFMFFVLELSQLVLNILLLFLLCNILKLSLKHCSRNHVMPLFLFRLIYQIYNQWLQSHLVLVLELNLDRLQ